MAFPKKGLRKITVDGHRYGYNITGNDGWISFSIGLLEKNGQLLTGGFSYHENVVTDFGQDGTPKSWRLYQRIKITPHTIRQLILYGLKNGWDPFHETGQMRLDGVEEKIELNLKEETSFPKLKHGQVALNFAKQSTGHVLKLSGEPYTGEGELYAVFKSLEEAKEFSREKIRNKPEMECWIMKEKDRAIAYLSSTEEREFES